MGTYIVRFDIGVRVSDKTIAPGKSYDELTDKEQERLTQKALEIIEGPDPGNVVDIISDSDDYEDNDDDDDDDND